MIDFNDIFKDYAILDKEEVRNHILTKAYSKEKLGRMYTIRAVKDDTRILPLSMILVCSLMEALNDHDCYLIEYRGDKEILDESDRYLGRRMIEKIF